MEKRILEIIAEICEDEIVIEQPDINVSDEDLMDSLEYTELLIQLEEEFGVLIAPSEYTREEMDTPRKIVKVVMEKLKG